LLLTGRLSLATHPWLTDHAVMDTVLLPGTAFLELALHAAERTGAEGVAELTLQAPLILPEAGAVQIQVSVEAPDETGQRQIAIHSHSEDLGTEEAPEWALHASGTLSETAPAPPEPLGEWPPTGAEPIQIDSLYERLSDAGLQYGPAFQGLSAAWRVGEEILAEVSLADGQREEAERFAIHPALLDSALHAATLTAEQKGVSLPFSWSEVGLEATGPSELRVRLRREGEAISLDLSDPTGQPIASVGALRTRAISPEQLSAKPRQEGLLGIEWAEVELASFDPAATGSGGDVPTIATVGEPQRDGARSFESIAALAQAIEAGEPAPHAVLLKAKAKASEQEAKAARALTESALDAAQQWLSHESLAGSRLAFLTTSAVATGEEESPDLAAASLWGLLRSAQSEHPGRFALIDTDGTEGSVEALGQALAQAEESQLALRGGRALAPRLVRQTAPQLDEESPALDPNRTVLITGATGGLGSLIARHLVAEHGARHLLLISRSGEEAPGAKELRKELQDLGAQVRIEACDASSRKQLGRLIDSIEDEHPLGAIVHAAGTLADATIESLDPEQIERVFAPKADAAWHLHELTADADLQAFVAFSSAAGILGSPGQGNYAAANTFLDALVQRRQVEGLPATSIAWGLWETASGMTDALGEADLKRMEQSGIAALSATQGLALFDQGLASERGLTVAIRTNRAGLRDLAASGVLPPILRGLIRAPQRRAAASAAILQHLAGLSDRERGQAVLDLVLSRVAAVLGHESTAEIDPTRAFQE
ncbi:MAG TPA: type I polyketide synthase, partial [Solirubrobacterales bacterium]